MTNIRESVCSHPLHGLVKRFTGTFPTNKVLVETTHELLCCFVVYGPQCHQHWTCTRSQERMSNSNNSLGTDVSTCTVATAKDNQFCLKSNLWDVGHCQYVVFLSRYLFFSRFLFSWFPIKRVHRSKISPSCSSSWVAKWITLAVLILWRTAYFVAFFSAIKGRTWSCLPILSVFFLVRDSGFAWIS